jgi:hypothetical protein
MNKKIKAKWIAALRGGLYKQGRGELRSKSNRVCPLGVLCDVVDPKGWDKDEHDTWHHRGDYCVPYAPKVLKALGTFDFLEIVYLSDSKKWTFNEIADFIELES